MTPHLFFRSTRLIRRALHFVLVSVLVVSSLRSQARMGVDSLFSPAVGKTMRMTVLLPEGYSGERRYATLYLLHGYGGTHTDWSTRTRLVEYTRALPLIVVMPEAENSWYVNSPTDSSRRFEDYMVNDLRRYVHRRYAVDTMREAIAGLSMGGFGAVTLALKYPSVFRFAGSLSGALSFAQDVMDTTTRAGKLIAASFPRLPLEPPARRAAFARANDPRLLFRIPPREIFPYLYLVMGTGDAFEEFLPAHRVLTDSLRASSLPYEYRETPGGHHWQYWDRELLPLLTRVVHVLK